MLESLEEGILLLQDQEIVFKNQIFKELYGELIERHTESTRTEIDIKCFQVYEEDKKPAEASSSISLKDILRQTDEDIQNKLYKLEC